VVNDDAETLELWASALRKDETLDICLAKDATEARHPFETGPDLIICSSRDYREWKALRRQIKKDDGPQAPLILLVSEGAEVAELAGAPQQGPDHYIEKSLCSSLLLPRARSLVSAGRLRRKMWEEGRRLSEANALLERNFRELTALSLKILEVRVPGASDRAETAREIGEFLCQGLDLPEERRKSIIFGALLHEIGKVGLPDELVGKHPTALPAALIPAFYQYAAVGSMIISTITGYRESAEAVAHQLENYDGSGIPDELIGEEIPVGARILRAVIFQEELRAEGRPTEEIIERVRLAMHSILDQKIANLLIEFLLTGTTTTDTNRLKLRLDELKPGMVIAEDVFAASGVKLLPKGVPLQGKTLALLTERNETDPIVGGVYILTDWSLLYGP